MKETTNIHIKVETAFTLLKVNVSTKTDKSKVIELEFKTIYNKNCVILLYKTERQTLKKYYLWSDYKYYPLSKIHATIIRDILKDRPLSMMNLIILCTVLDENIV